MGDSGRERLPPHCQGSAPLGPDDRSADTQQTVSKRGEEAGRCGQAWRPQAGVEASSPPR